MAWLNMLQTVPIRSSNNALPTLREQEMRGRTLSVLQSTVVFFSLRRPPECWGKLQCSSPNNHRRKKHGLILHIARSLSFPYQSWSQTCSESSNSRRTILTFHARLFGVVAAPTSRLRVHSPMLLTYHIILFHALLYDTCRARKYNWSALCESEENGVS